jgi:RHS repeat-associated protein
MHVENSDETVATRYFHKDHLGSISVITDESGAVLERLSYDAWGKRRHADGSDDPSGSITSQSSRGFTGHEELDSVGLVHMNGRVYDPLLARFGTADPMTESPFSTQGWNRYSYVGNSPLNFTDPSGYCFMGCFWKPIFKAIGNFLRENWGSLVQIAAAAICAPMGMSAVCAVAATTIITGITSGDLGLALRAGFIAAVTAGTFYAVGSLAPTGTLLNIAGHAAVGCLSAVASGGKCGPGALAAGISAAGTPLIGQAFRGNPLGGTLASSVLGGLGSVAGGGKFGNGAVTGAFGYLFNYLEHEGKATEAIERLKSQSPTAANMIKTLEDSPRTWTVTFDESAQLYAEGAAETNGYKRTITINPTKVDGFEFLSVDGTWFTRPVDVWLGHELGHAVTIERVGVLNAADVWSGNYDRAITFENQIARELNKDAPVRVPTHRYWRPK